MHSRHSNFSNNKTQQAGFTLIELMIAMVISLTLIFACTTLYSSLKSSITIAQDLSKAQESLRGSFYLMSRSLRQAQGFTIGGASGAAGTELTTTFGESPIGEVIYSCLGNPRDLGDEDIYSRDDNGLYCDDGSGRQLIALDVNELRFENITGNNDDGIKVRMKIAGMPELTYPNGLSFTLALRQKILLELAE